MSPLHAARAGGAVDVACVGSPRLLAYVRRDRTTSLADHRACFGPLPAVPGRERRGRSSLVDLLDAARLAGRGGAGYPVGRKARAAAEHRGPRYLVLNGAESEPASRKDHLLLERAPHLVLDGASMLARAVGATEVIVWVKRTDWRLLAALERAIAERALGSDDAAPVRVAPAPARYLSGESSAALNHLGGGPSKPTYHRAPAAVRGLRGRPTLVLNVETVAQVAVLARDGMAGPAHAVPAAETMLFTVSGVVRRPVVVEAPVGASLAEVVAAAGGPIEPASAYLLGGYFGRWLAVPHPAAVALSHSGLRAIGGRLGAGIVVGLPDRACGLVETAPVVAYLAAEGAGQCGPCLNGLPAIAGAFEELAAGTGRGEAILRLRRWSAMVNRRGACAHPDGVAQLVTSALDVFHDEAVRHTRGRCAAPALGLLPVPSAAEGWR